MDIVLGVSLAPDSVRLVLVQGESADGTTIDENEFLVDDAPTVSASDRVIAAVVGTRDDANRAGIAVSSVGVACTDQLAATALRDALAAHKVENVMLVSAFVAAAALAQSAGAARGYENTAMLLVEPTSQRWRWSKPRTGPLPKSTRHPSLPPTHSPTWWPGWAKGRAARVA